MTDEANRPKTVRANLPDVPLVVIDPSTVGIDLNLRELWSYRELLYFLIWRDVKIRYKQTLLGATWAIMQPLFTMVIFTFIFSKVARIDSNGIPYPIFAYSALLPWIFFANAIGAASNSVVGSTQLITKVYFPRVLIPVAAVGAGLVDFAIGFVLLIGLLFYYRVEPTVNLLLLPPMIVLTVLLAIAFGLWLSAMNVRYRDIRFAVPFLTQIWMYLSPVAYPSSVFSAKWRLIYSLNPLAGIIEGYRSALFGRVVDWRAMGIAVLITVTTFIFAWQAFRKMEKSFADII